MKRNILLPTDFSACSVNAIDYALAMFADEGCKFTLINAVEIPVDVVNGTSVVLPQIMERAKKAMSELYDQVLPKLQGTSSTLDQRVEMGGGLVDIVGRVASELDAGMIILGTKGASGVKEVLLGSVAKSILHNVRVPVIVVPEEARFTGLNHVVFAADYKEMVDDTILHPMLHVGTKYDSTITLLHTEPEGVILGEDEVEQEYELHKQLKDIRHDFEFVETSDPLAGIEKYVNERQPDLVVMVSRHDRIWERIFHSSVAGRFAMHTTTPLLIAHDR